MESMTIILSLEGTLQVIEARYQSLISLIS